MGNNREPLQEGVYTKLNTIIDNMEELDNIVQSKQLTGANAELFKQVVEISTRWFYVWEQEYSKDDSSE